MFELLPPVPREPVHVLPSAFQRPSAYPVCRDFAFRLWGGTYRLGSDAAGWESGEISRRVAAVTKAADKELSGWAGLTHAFRGGVNTDSMTDRTTAGATVETRSGGHLFSPIP